MEKRHQHFSLRCPFCMMYMKRLLKKPPPAPKNFWLRPCKVILFNCIIKCILVLTPVKFELVLIFIKITLFSQFSYNRTWLWRQLVHSLPGDSNLVLLDLRRKKTVRKSKKFPKCFVKIVNYYSWRDLIYRKSDLWRYHT